MAYRENIVAGSIDHGGLAGLADDDHGQYHNDTRGDARYYRENEHVQTSTGAGDAGKPIILDAGGQIDATMLNDGDVDHGSIGGLADDDHTQYHNDTRGDARYFTEAEHISTSAGAADAGKPIKLDAGGQVDATMVNDADIDHGSIGGLVDDDHTQYLLADGTRALSGNWAVGSKSITGISTLGCSGASITSLTQGSVLFIGASGTVLQDNANFFWNAGLNRLGVGTSSPTATLHAYATTGIVGKMETDAGVALDPVSEVKRQSYVQTTDATVTNLFVIGTSSDTVNHIDVVITGRRTGGVAGNNGDCGSYKYAATVKNVGGVLSYVAGTVAMLYTREDQIGWAISFSTSGTNATIRVAGAVDNTLKWHGTATIQSHST